MQDTTNLILRTPVKEQCPSRRTTLINPTTYNRTTTQVFKVTSTPMSTTTWFLRSYGYGSYPTEGTLQARKQPYPSTSDGAYPYTGLHVNTGYASPTSGGGLQTSGSSHSSPHEAYTPFSTHSEASMPSPRAHSTPRRERSQPLLSHLDLDRYISPQALYAHLSNTDLAGSPGQGRSPTTETPGTGDLPQTRGHLHPTRSSKWNPRAKYPS